MEELRDSKAANDERQTTNGKPSSASFLEENKCGELAETQRAEATAKG